MSEIVDLQKVKSLLRSVLMAAKEGIPANKLQSKIFFFHRIYQLLMFLLVVMSGDGSGHPINLDYKKVRDDCA